MSDLVAYIATREEIKRCDTSRFLAEFGLSDTNNLPPKWNMGSIMFTIEAYDHEIDEIYSIPEVRAYYQKIHQQWPCWMYYSELTSESLKIIALCIFDTFSATKVADTQSARIVFPEHALHQFAEDGLLPLALLGEKAGLPVEVVEDRLNAVMDYLGFEKKSAPYP